MILLWKRVVLDIQFDIHVDTIFVFNKIYTINRNKNYNYSEIMVGVYNLDIVESIDRISKNRQITVHLYSPP